MSARQYRSQDIYYSNSTQPVQQQFYPTNQMVYNEYYQPTNENHIYARSMATYGGNNGTINADANGDGYSSRRHFNVNAPAFEPRSTVQPQYIQQTANYSAPYSAYMQQTVIGQPIHNIQQTPWSSHQQINIHSPVQQHQTSKYQQIPMSQNSQQLYGMGVQQQQIMSAYHNGADYQQEVAQTDVGAYGSQFNQFPISHELSESIQNSPNRMAIIEVQVGLEQLVSEPQEFDLWANAIKARVASGISSEDANLIAWLLVEMSYMGTNAQYSFSRLCKLLDSEIKNFTIQYVIPKIARLIGSNGVADLSPEYLSNFITFLAELYDKTEVNGVRISRIAQYILDQILVQLNGEKLNDAIVKNIVNVMKLIGRHVEEDQDPERLKQVFQRLDALQTSCPDISSAVKNNIRQLNLLRERNWGVVKNEEGFGSSSMTGSFYQNGQNEGVIYGPDGQPISEEERLFLEENCNAIEQYADMDAETMAAYETFLQEQTEETALGVAQRALERMSMDDDVVNNSKQV